MTNILTALTNLLTHAQADPHCAIALLKAAGYAAIALLARYCHAKIWLGYIPMVLLELAAAALLAGVLAIAPG